MSMTTATAPPRIAGPPRVAASGQCPRCSGPVDAADRFCPSCGLTLDHAGRGDEPGPSALSRAFRCQSCEAEVRCAPDSRSTPCPFCAVPYVLEIDPAVSARQAPEFVLGFSLTPHDAERLYRDWVRSDGLFHPSDLAETAQADGLKGIYLFFWSFSCRADSTWTAEIGEHWTRTETYTERDANGNMVTKTRQVTETEWYPLAGGHPAFHSFTLVSGSTGLPQEEFDRIQPFQLLALKRYAPQFLAGWLSEEYSVAKEDAYPLSEAAFRKAETRAIAAFPPGDTQRGLRVDTAFSRVNSDLILLPIYLRTYRDNGWLYRTLINGQTGKIAGQKPISGYRIAGFVAGIVLLIAVVVLLVLQRMR